MAKYTTTGRTQTLISTSLHHWLTSTPSPTATTQTFCTGIAPGEFRHMILKPVHFSSVEKGLNSLSGSNLTIPTTEWEG